MAVNVLKHENRIVKWKKRESKYYGFVQGKFAANALPQASQLISAATSHYSVGFPQYHHVNIRGAIIRQLHVITREIIWSPILVLLESCLQTCMILTKERPRAEPDGTRAETRFRLSPK